MVMLLCVDEHAHGSVGLLQLVVDGDEGLQEARVGVSAVELLLLVVQCLGVRTTVHGTLA